MNDFWVTLVKRNEEGEAIDVVEVYSNHVWRIKRFKEAGYVAEQTPPVQKESSVKSSSRTVPDESEH